jgi:thiol-disulfide isomerase/thioredoxin
MALPGFVFGAGPQPLKIGDPAPRFKVGRWLKGTPISGLEAGKVYVIDFFGILCEPCIQAIPRVSALAKKYSGRATFIGLSLVKWTATEPYPESAMPHQLAFMKQHAKQMDYRVVTDTPDGYMAIHLFDALGLESIPHAVVIGRNRRVAWVGDIDGLDRAVSNALAAPQ